jgi:hypothetical protein
VKDRFDIALDNASMLRSAYRRAKGIHDTNRKTKEKLSEIDSLNRLFPDDDPETFQKDGKTYVVFRVKRTEEMSGETFVEPVSIPLDTIDSIFQDYALHGDNLTGQQVCDKYGLSGKAWNAIRARMNLNKMSSVRSDVTLKEMSDEGHEAIASQHVMNRTKQRMREAHDKEVKRLLLITSSTENYLNFVRQKIEGYKPISVKLPKAKRPANDDVLSIVMSDIHLGRVGSEETVRRLARIQTDAILASENVIHVDFLGDLAETFVQDGMHPGQLADMDGRWGKGFDLMMNVVGTLETFLIEMSKAGKRVHFT